MSWVLPQNAPRILLIDFYAKEVEELRSVGYVVEWGRSGFYDGIHELPSPHEKEVVFYDTSHHSWEPSEERPVVEWKTPKEYVDYIRAVVQRGGWVVCFVDEKCKDNNLSIVGLGMGLQPIPESKRFLPAKSVSGYFDPVMSVFDRFKDSLLVHYSITGGGGYRQALMTDELERTVAMAVWAGETRGRYLLLPSFRRNFDVVKYLLSDVLPEAAPHLFPSRENFDWLDEDYFDAPEIASIKENITTLERETEEKLANYRSEIDEIERALKPFQLLLMADDEHFQGDDRLSKCVEHVLGYLGFDVTNVDEENPYGDERKREDLWVQDPDDKYFAICECRGTTRGPRDGDYMDVVKWVRHAQSHLARTDLRGLLILNFQREHDARKRASLFESSPHIIRQAEDGKDGLLSTVELWKIAMAVRRGDLSRAEARDLVKQPGLILYPEI